MKKVRLLSLSLITTLICSLVPGVAASKYTTSSEKKEYDSVISDSNSSCDVYVEIGSNFRITIPKEIVLDGTTKEGSYLVCVEGDIAGMEVVKVVPEDTVKLYSTDKAEVIGNISQDKTKWFCDEILDDNIVIGKGTIEADAITAGSWNGNFNFNISLNNNLIGVESTDENGNNLNASAENIVNTEKKFLLEELDKSGLANADEIDAIIEVESDDFENLAKTVFNVSNIAKPGDKVVILHFNEETNEWEYISTEIVADDGTITVYMDSYSPVAFFKVEDKLEHKHSYIESIKESTCTQLGEKIFTCECGDTYTEEIAVLGHDYKAVITNSTCTEKGYTTYTCSRCNDTYTDSVVAATGHDYNLTITDATCTTNGNKHYECKNCNSKYDEAISATGHVYDATKYVTDKAATCTEAGSKSVHCNVCKAIITSTVTTIPATGHSYSTTYTTDKAATCSAEGSKSQHCTRSGCSAKQNVTTIAKLAHTNVNGGTSGIHTKCSVCGATTSSTHSYTVDSGVQYKAATCTANRQNYKRCSCGYNPKSASYIVAVANTATGHTYGTPTYSWNGTTCAAQRVCSKCQVVQAENATITNAVTKAATCTEAGVRTYTAKFTNTAFAAQTKTASIAATGHTQVNGGTSGVHKKCSVCGITTSTAHSYTTTITKPWTCAGDGAKKHTCSCGYSYTETVPATGHSYGAGVLVGQMTGYTAWDGGVWFEYTTYASNVEMTAAICGSCPSHYYYIYPTNYAGDWYGTRTKMSYIGIANSLYHYRYNQYLSSAGKYYFLFWEDCDSLANTSQYWTSVVTRYSCTKCGNYYDVKDRT